MLKKTKKKKKNLLNDLRINKNKQKKFHECSIAKYR